MRESGCMKMWWLTNKSWKPPSKIGQNNANSHDSKAEKNIVCRDIYLYVCVRACVCMAMNRREWAENEKRDGNKWANKMESGMGDRKRREWKSVWSDQTWCLPTFYYYFINREISSLSTYTILTMDGQAHTHTHSRQLSNFSWTINTYCVNATSILRFVSWVFESTKHTHTHIQQYNTTHTHTRTHVQTELHRETGIKYSQYLLYIQTLIHTSTHRYIRTHEHTYKEVEKGKSCPCSSSSKSNSIRSQHQKQ